MIAQPALGAGLMQVMELCIFRRLVALTSTWRCYSSPVIGCGPLKTRRQHWTKSPERPTCPCRRTIAIYKAVMKPCFETRQLPRCRDAYGDIIPLHRARARATPPARTGGRDSRRVRSMEAPADEIGAGGSVPAAAATLAFTLKIYTPPTLHLESASALYPCEAPAAMFPPLPLGT
jgi:hypothetical protein